MGILAFLCCALFIFFISRMKTIFAFTFILMAAVLFQQGTFIVNEGSQVVITQFGEIIGKSYKKPGLYFKVPFLWKAHYFDDRVYTDTDSEGAIITKDQYLISVDVVSHWRIKNPNLFFVKMNGANDEIRVLLRNLISGSVRETVAKNNLVDTLRTNRLQHQIFLNHQTQHPIPNQHWVYTNVDQGRDKLSDTMHNEIQKYVSQFGVEIINILIVNVQYSSDVEKRIFERMILKRFTKAAELRSKGMQYYQVTQGNLEKNYQSIIAPAKKQALIIKSKADATATKIYAESYGQNLHFFHFLRMMQAYKQSLPNMSQGMLFSTDSNFLKYLKSYKIGVKKPRNIKPVTKWHPPKKSHATKKVKLTAPKRVDVLELGDKSEQGAIPDSVDSSKAKNKITQDNAEKIEKSEEKQFINSIFN